MTVTRTSAEWGGCAHRNSFTRKEPRLRWSGRTVTGRGAAPGGGAGGPNPPRPGRFPRGRFLRGLVGSHLAALCLVLAVPCLADQESGELSYGYHNQWTVSGPFRVEAGTTASYRVTKHNDYSYLYVAVNADSSTVGPEGSDCCSFTIRPQTGLVGFGTTYGRTRAGYQGRWGRAEQYLHVDVAADAGGQTFKVGLVRWGSGQVPGHWAHSQSRRQYLTVTVTDTRGPTLSSAVVNGSSLVLRYDEPLSSSRVPPVGAFSVTADGAAVVVSSVSVNDYEVTLTLASAVAYGRFVQVGYSTSMSPRISDRRLNQAATVQGVQQDDPTLRSLFVVRGGTLDQRQEERLVCRPEAGRNH